MQSHLLTDLVRQDRGTARDGHGGLVATGFDRKDGVDRQTWKVLTRVVLVPLATTQGSTKSEIRNPKQIQNPKLKIQNKPERNSEFTTKMGTPGMPLNSERDSSSTSDHSSQLLRAPCSGIGFLRSQFSICFGFRISDFGFFNLSLLLKTLKLIADPTRLRLLRLLREQEFSVAELQEILSMGQSRISTQLAQLKGAGLVEDRRAGKKILYGAAGGPALEPLWKSSSKRRRGTPGMRPRSGGAHACAPQALGPGAHVF